ncbi:MAG: hypothetical protein GX285_00205 [Clostridiales bacterium]|nr:hypothetical protein [Clostridiales bacterium]
MLKWLTQYRQPITTVIALLGFALSIFQLIRDWYRKREAYKVSVIDYRKYVDRHILLMIQITNLSESALVITEIKLNGAPSPLEPEHVRGAERALDYRLSEIFPVCVDAKGAKILFLKFTSQDLLSIDFGPGTKLTLEVQSTRNMKQHNLALGEKARYLPDIPV